MDGANAVNTERQKSAGNELMVPREQLIANMKIKKFRKAKIKMLDKRERGDKRGRSKVKEKLPLIGIVKEGIFYGKEHETKSDFILL